MHIQPYHPDRNAPRFRTDQLFKNINKVQRKLFQL